MTSKVFACVRFLTALFHLKKRSFVLPLLVFASACHQGDTEDSSNADKSGLPPDEMKEQSAQGNVKTSDQNRASPADLTRGLAIAFEGRIETTPNPNTPVLGWAGSRVQIGFAGSSLTVKLRAFATDSESLSGQLSDTFISVSVDEAAAKTTQLSYGTNTIVAAQNLPEGQHEVSIVKKTEGRFGSLQFLEAKTDGSLTFTTPPPTRKIEFIGDSGATGWGAAGLLGDKKTCASSPLAEDVTLAFPLVTAKLLGAEVHNISYAGKGLVQNRDVVSDAFKTMPRLWTRRLPNSFFFDAGEKDTGAWDPKSWVANAVILVVSGNDFYANNGPSREVFQQTISSFVKVLRTSYPLSQLYLMVSPMLHNEPDANGGYSPTARTDAIAWSRSVIASQEDKASHFLDIPEDNGDLGISCDYHMTAATHRAVAKMISSAVATDLGWKL